MKNRLWFITNGVSVISAHLNKKEAMDEYERFSDEDDFEYYEAYSVLIDDLEDYPDEMDMAIEYGYL